MRIGKYKIDPIGWIKTSWLGMRELTGSVVKFRQIQESDYVDVIYSDESRLVDKNMKGVLTADHSLLYVFGVPKFFITTKYDINKKNLKKVYYASELSSNTVDFEKAIPKDIIKTLSNFNNRLNDEWVNKNFAGFVNLSAKDFGITVDFKTLDDIKEKNRDWSADTYKEAGKKLLEIGEPVPNERLMAVGIICLLLGICLGVLLGVWIA